MGNPEQEIEEDVPIDNSGFDSLIEEEQKANPDKTITIKTTRVQNRTPNLGYFPKDVNYRAYMSQIDFSHPVMDDKGRSHKKLTLRTVWFTPDNPYWTQDLVDERGETIYWGSSFGNLDGHFMDYSELKLRQFQTQGWNAHEGALDRLNRLFYQPRDAEISKDFFQSE